jgi:hypothetical protein
MKGKQNPRNINRELNNDNQALESVQNNRPSTRHGISLNLKSFTQPNSRLKALLNGGEDLEEPSNNLDEMSSISEFVDEYKLQKKNEPDIPLKVDAGPGACLSDPAFLELKQRLLSKSYDLKKDKVWSIEDAKTNPEAIDQWIQSVQELQKMRQSLHSWQDRHDYPSSIDDLSPSLPAELKRELLSASEQDVRVPDPNLDISIEEYAKVLCSLLDIPVDDGSIITSIHTLFHLYLNMKAMKMESL